MLLLEIIFGIISIAVSAWFISWLAGIAYALLHRGVVAAARLIELAFCKEPGAWFFKDYDAVAADYKAEEAGKHTGTLYFAGAILMVVVKTILKASSPNSPQA